MDYFSRAQTHLSRIAPTKLKQVSMRHTFDAARHIE
jgi:hypothetical protein